MSLKTVVSVEKKRSKKTKPKPFCVSVEKRKGKKSNPFLRDHNDEM